jgi:hypothetical protein
MAIDGDRFDLVELDLLATHAGVPFPFPLRVPSFGRTAAERDEELAAAGQALSARGLANGFGPLGIAAEVVTALREYRGTVDLVVGGEDAATGVAALVYRTTALVCGQSFEGGQAGPVRVRRIPQTAVADELVGSVVAVSAAPTLPITLPPGVVHDALRLVGHCGDNESTRSLVRRLIRDRGGDPDVLGRLIGLLPTVTGRGQVGVTRRAGAGHTRAGTELSWLDSPSGRVRIDQADNGWTSINPLRCNDFRLAISASASVARAPW